MTTPIRFDEQAVIVTGAGHGLGREFALEFARRGAAVVVNDIGTHPDSGRSTAELVAEEIVMAGGQAIANTGSVADADDATEMVAAAVERFGGIHAVVNNAALIRQAWFEDLDLELLDSMLAVNLRGSILVTQAAYEHMRRARYGRVVSLSSGAGAFGMLGQVGYGAAKAGLIGMTNVLALEGAEHGVLANIVLPAAATSRGRTKVAWRPGDREVVGPRMRPELITPLALYLASSACVPTGHLYSSVGGRYARVFMGVGPGWLSPAGADVTAEDIAEHLEVIDNLSEFAIPTSHESEFALVADQVREAQRATETHSGSTVGSSS